MKKILSILLVFAMCLSVTFALTACGEPKDAGAEVSVYLGSNVYDFDPTDYYEDRNAEQIMSMLFEPLFKLSESGKLEMGMAESYQIDKENNRIVVQLRESYWSDEVRVKAADFIYSWRDVILEPNNPNPASALLFDIENAIEVKSGEKSIYEFGAAATGAYEITINCREGADYDRLLKNLASINTSPLREDIVSQAKTYWTKTLSIIVSNGPFKISALNYGTYSFELSRNLGYHQPSSAKNYTANVTPNVLYNFISEDGERVELKYSDILDKTVFYLAETGLSDLSENAENAMLADDLSTYSYVFNTDKPLFKNVNVRRALSLALDRKAMAAAAVIGTAANGFLPNVISKIEEDRISTDADMDAAKALLAKVDFKGISKSFTLSVNDDERSVAMAELAKEAWEELGFKVTIRKLSVKNTVVNDKVTNSKLEISDSALQVLLKEASYGNRSYDVMGINWQMYSEDAFVALASFTSHMNGYGIDYATGKYRTNISGWWNSGYDALINNVFTAKTEKERREVLAEAEKYLLEYAPVAPVLYNTNYTFVAKDFRGVKADGYGNFVLTKANLKDYEKYLKD